MSARAMSLQFGLDLCGRWRMLVFFKKMNDFKAITLKYSQHIESDCQGFWRAQIILRKKF